MDSYNEKFNSQMQRRLQEDRPPAAAPFEQTDPWAHRSEGMRCQTCMWFILKMDGPTTRTLGRCRRHAPVVGLGFPAVFTNDWCGDHKLR